MSVPSSHESVPLVHARASGGLVAEVVTRIQPQYSIVRYAVIQPWSEAKTAKNTVT